MAKAEPKTSKEGDPFKRFESLTKRLVAVPKKELNGQPKEKPKPSRSARRK